MSTEYRIFVPAGEHQDFMFDDGTLGFFSVEPWDYILMKGTEAEVRDYWDNLSAKIPHSLPFLEIQIREVTDWEPLPADVPRGNQ